MVTFSKIGSLGRLGNQLFQYAALRALSIKLGTDVGIPKVKCKYHGQEYLLGKLNIPSEFFKDKIRPKKSTWEEKHPRNFDHSFFNQKDNTDICGQFENYKYFKDIEDIIKTELQVNKETQDKVQSELTKRYGTSSLVAIHIRRGDLLKKKKRKALYTEDYYSTYLKKALEYMPKKDTTFLLFTGGARDGNRQEDLKWCRNNIKLDNAHVIDYFNDIEDFTAISQCDHMILGYSSTFAWWAGYLGYNKDKIIIAPKNPLVVKTQYDDEFYPEFFKRVDHV